MTIIFRRIIITLIFSIRTRRHRNRANFNRSLTRLREKTLNGAYAFLRIIIRLRRTKPLVARSRLMENRLRLTATIGVRLLTIKLLAILLRYALRVILMFRRPRTQSIRTLKYVKVLSLTVAGRRIVIQGYVVRERKFIVLRRFIRRMK